VNIIWKTAPWASAGTNSSYQVFNNVVFMTSHGRLFGNTANWFSDAVGSLGMEYRRTLNIRWFTIMVSRNKFFTDNLQEICGLTVDHQHFIKFCVLSSRSRPYFSPVPSCGTCSYTVRESTRLSFQDSGPTKWAEMNVDLLVDFVRSRLF